MLSNLTDMEVQMKTNYRSTLSVAFVALSAVAAQAQDVGFCGQPAALTRANVTISGEDAAPVDGIIDIQRGEPSYIDLTIQNPTGITFETHSNYDDPIVILMDEYGNMVRSDDDGTGTLNSRLGAELEPGRYCLHVSTLTEIPASSGMLPSGYNTRFPFQISTGIAPGAGGCSSQMGLTRIEEPLYAGSSPISLEGSLPNGGAFAFTLAEPMGLAISSRSFEFDTMLILEDSFNAEVGFDDDSGGGTDSFINIPDIMPAGDYCVMVDSYDGTPGQFNMTISEWTIEAETSGYNGGMIFDPCGDVDLTTVVSAPMMPGGPAQTFHQTLTGGASFFQFTLAAPMDLRVTSSSDYLDTVLSLHDADRFEIAYNDDYEGMGTNSRILSGGALPAGQYCVAVTPYSGDAVGQFSLEIIELTQEAMLAEAYARGEMLPGDNEVTFTDLGLVERSLRNAIASDSTEWFLFEVPEDSLIVADATTNGDISRLVVFDYEGSGLEINRAEWDYYSQSVQLVQNLSAGVYALAVVRDDIGGGVGPSRLSLQRFVRPAR